MNNHRRNFLKHSLMLSVAGATLLEPLLSKAEWNAEDFVQGPFADALKQVLNGKPIVDTDKIELTIPEIAENGAVVPVTISSSLPDIKAISLIAEQNPVPLTIQMQVTPNIEPFLSARLKLANTSFVFAIAEAEKVCYSVKKKVKVTIGGCGG